LGLTVEVFIAVEGLAVWRLASPSVAEIGYVVSGPPGFSASTWPGCQDVGTSMADTGVHGHGPAHDLVHALIISRVVPASRHRQIYGVPITYQPITPIRDIPSIARKDPHPAC